MNYPKLENIRLVAFTFDYPMGLMGQIKGNFDIPFDYIPNAILI